MAVRLPTLSGIPRFFRLLANTIRSPDDIPQIFIVGYFIWTISGKLHGRDLPSLLSSLRLGARIPARDPYSSAERIYRLRTPWLWLPIMSAKNTCYVRAMTLYRFLDPGSSDLKIHFGVEPGVTPEDRLRGHAWVTLDGEVIEELTILGRPVREIYVHPPS